MTTTTEALPITMEPEMNRRQRAKRKTFREVRESERARYEPLMQELADEINKLRDELEAERETLATIRGSWLAALRYWAKGEV
jgi:hypothetical protein